MYGITCNTPAHNHIAENKPCTKFPYTCDCPKRIHPTEMLNLLYSIHSHQCVASLRASGLLV